MQKTKDIIVSVDLETLEYLTHLLIDMLINDKVDDFLKYHKLTRFNNRLINAYHKALDKEILRAVDIKNVVNSECDHHDTTIIDDEYEVCNDCGAYLGSYRKI